MSVDTLAHFESESPRSKLFHKQVRAVASLMDADSPMKKTMVAQLATNFVRPQPGGSLPASRADETCGGSLSTKTALAI
jgi:hypothetical protein